MFFKHKGMIIVFGVMLLAGCGAAIQAYKPAIVGTLGGAEVAAHALKAAGVAGEDPAMCYVGAGIATAAHTARSVVETWTPQMAGGTLPAADLDVADCHALLKMAPKPIVPSSATTKAKLLLPTVTGMIQGLLAVVGLDCERRNLGQAVLDYLEGALPSIIDELSDPDGKVTILEVKVAPCP